MSRAKKIQIARGGRC